MEEQGQGICLPAGSGAMRIELALLAERRLGERKEEKGAEEMSAHLPARQSPQEAGSGGKQGQPP